MFIPSTLDATRAINTRLVLLAGVVVEVVAEEDVEDDDEVADEVEFKGSSFISPINCHN